MQFSVGNYGGVNPQRRQPTGRQQSVGTSSNKRTIRNTMLDKAKGKYSEVPDLTKALNKKTIFTDKSIELKMEMVFKFKEGSVPSTETGEMGLKCFFLEQSLESGSTTKEECIATCNALFDYVTNFKEEVIGQGTLFGDTLGGVFNSWGLNESSGRLNNSPKDLATKMHYFEDLLQRCDDQYPGAMKAVMTSKGMVFSEPASRPQPSRATRTGGQSMADNAARHRLNISYDEQHTAKYKSEQNELKNEKEIDLSLKFFNKDQDPDDDESTQIPEKQFQKKYDAEQQLKQKFASAQHQENNISRPDSPTGVDQVPIFEQENLKTRSLSKQVNVNKTTKKHGKMSGEQAQDLIQTIFDEIVTDNVFKNSRSSFQAVMDAFRKGTVFTDNDDGKRGKNETCGTDYLNRNHKQKIMDISNGKSKQSKGVQRICELFKNHAQELEQLIDSQDELEGEDIYYDTSTLKSKLSWVEKSFVKNEIQVTTDSFILMAKVMINHESLKGSAAGNFAHRLSELVR